MIIPSFIRAPPPGGAELASTRQSIRHEPAQLMEMTMAARSAKAEWRGSLSEGNGTIKFGSGAFESQYSFKSRFENEKGTNPEELIAAAHAGCFSMALSLMLGKAGFRPQRIHTTATVHIEKVDEGFKITHIDLDTEAEIPNIDEQTFQQQAEAAKRGCPVSQALAGTEIRLNARLLRA
jgi:lipoyl-dependent peroxiredoxin